VSGYQWSSSRGPDVVISSGTTASGRVAVVQRAPITYVVPSLRELGGL
jgi:HlyD family secretion protein